MELRHYLQSNKKQIKQFCLENGLAYGYFRHILNKRKRPSPDLALKISVATNGKVPILELLYPKNRKPANNGKQKAA